MPTHTTVIRRVGGLEGYGMHIAPHDIVIRRVGGLEDERRCSVIDNDVIRRVGGLEGPVICRVDDGSVIRRVGVISPFVVVLKSRAYAARFSFMAGVIPPMPIWGRSLL